MSFFSRIYLILLLLLLPIVLLASWVVGAYNSEVRSLLDSDGVRWGITHILSNFSRLPLATIIILLVTISTVMESGWLSWINPKNHPLMLKQVRAYTYTNLLLIILFLFFVFVLLMPGTPLLNAFGGLANSPLEKSWFPLLSLIIIFISNIFGYLSGRLTTSADFTFAHTRLLRKYTPSFLPLFVVAQISGCLQYSNLLTFTSSSTEQIIMYILICLCFVR